MNPRRLWDRFLVRIGLRAPKARFEFFPGTLTGTPRSADRLRRLLEADISVRSGSRSRDA